MTASYFNFCLMFEAGSSHRSSENEAVRASTEGVSDSKSVESNTKLVYIYFIHVHAVQDHPHFES